MFEFDSIEEFAAWSAAETDQANEALDDRQRAITWGSYWIRFWPTPPDITLIFGYVMPLDELEASERKLGADDDEIAYMREHYTENHERGYMYGKAHSIIEPGGEWGDTHRANMWPISKETYDKSVSMNCNPTLIRIAYPLVAAEIAVAYREYRAWAIARGGDE